MDEDRGDDARGPAGGDVAARDGEEVGGWLEGGVERVPLRPARAGTDLDAVDVEDVGVVAGGRGEVSSSCSDGLVEKKLTRLR